MGEIISFGQQAAEEERYLDEMSREELQEYLGQLQARIEQLDEREPADMNSEAYEAWAEEHEVLEDAVDEVVELLEELN